MYYNGKELKNLQEYVEANLGHSAFEGQLHYPEEFVNLVLDYHSSMGEFTDEDLEFIKEVDEALWENLGQYVEHYELQQWDDPAGEVIACNDYFSWESALKDYEEEVVKGGYWRIIPVDPDGIPTSDNEKANF